MTKEDTLRAFMMYDVCIPVILSKHISPLKDPEGDLEETEGARLVRGTILNKMSK